MFEYSKLEELQGNYSDLFKEVNGFRPRFASDSQWNSEDWLEREIEILCVELKQLAIEERLKEAHAIFTFEEKVNEMISLGAKTRENAIKWLFEAEAVSENDDRCKYDPDYFCYLNNLPYGYFKEVSI